MIPWQAAHSEGHRGRTRLEEQWCHFLCVHSDSHLFWGYGLPSSLPCSAATNLPRQALAPVLFLLRGCCHARLEGGDIIPASYFCHAVLMAQGLGGPVVYFWLCACHSPRQWPSSAVCSRTVSPTIKTPSPAACSSSLKIEGAKLPYSAILTQGNVVEMVRRSAEEVDDDREKAICVSSRFFGFLTENGIMQLFELPHDCLTH